MARPELSTDTNKSHAAESKIFQKCARQLDEYFFGQKKKYLIFHIQQETDFQQKVWKELIQIPYGKTISYIQLAQRMGNVKAHKGSRSCKRTESPVDHSSMSSCNWF